MTSAFEHRDSHGSNMFPASQHIPKSTSMSNAVAPGYPNVGSPHPCILPVKSIVGFRQGHLPEPPPSGNAIWGHGPHGFSANAATQNGKTWVQFCVFTVGVTLRAGSLVRPRTSPATLSAAVATFSSSFVFWLCSWPETQVTWGLWIGGMSF